MNGSSRPSSSRRRDAAVERLRSLTVGTAVAGLVATGGFGALAAFNYAGVPATGTDTQGGTGSNLAPNVPADQQPAGQDGSAFGVQPGGISTQPYAVVQAPSTHHRAHVSTGGSG